MNKAIFDNLIFQLTDEERLYLLKRLKSILFRGISRDDVKCPCCDEKNYFKNGKYKDTQKYKCRNTSRIFTYKSNTVFSGVWDIEKVEELLHYMCNDGFPYVEDIMRMLSVSRQTAFNWRTKIVTAVYETIDMDGNVVEFDETNFRLNWKGRDGLEYSRKRGQKLVGDNPFNVKVFMAYSRTTKKLELYTSHMGRTKCQDVENYLGTKRDIVVYSDKHRSYTKYYKKRGVLSNTFLSKYHTSKTNKQVHNQTINYFTGLLQKFINNDLRGVSTKYIQGYMNWIMFVQNCMKQNVDIKNVVAKNKVALEVYKQKEKELQYFLKNNGRNIYGTFNDKYYGKAA